MTAMPWSPFWLPQVVRLKEVPQTELEIRLAPRNEKWRREVARFCDREAQGEASKVGFDV